MKVAKPQQDLRFDMPVIGATTLELAARSGCGVIAVEAGTTLLFDKAALVRKADELALCLLGTS